MHKLLTIILFVLLLSGCSSVKAVFAMAKSTDDFMALEQNPAIAYEQGSEAAALKLASYLEAAIELVETKQFGVFPDEVKIYVPNSIDSFASYCASKAPSACVIGGRLFVSPRLFEEEERIQRILIHELSHLQMRQYTGWWNYQLDVPSWFAEGLAVYVSDGGGAEQVEKSQAKAAILSGRRFVPSGSGRLLFRETASSYDLKPHMFYRQASLFVEWLHDLNSDYFEQMIRLLHHGSTVEEAMVSSYGVTVHDGWNRFVAGLQQQERAQLQSVQSDDLTLQVAGKPACGVRFEIVV